MSLRSRSIADSDSRSKARFASTRSATASSWTLTRWLESNENRPWVRVASSAQAWVADPLENRSALGAGCAWFQVVITQRERCDIGSVCFRSILLSPRLRAGSGAYPGGFPEEL